MRIPTARPALLSILAVAALGMVVTPASHAATNLTHVTKLQLYFAGIPVGKLKLNIDIRNDSYVVSGSGESTGISKIFADTKGAAKSLGSLDGGTVQARSHALNFKQGKKSGTLTMNFNGGRMSMLKSTPPVVYKDDAIPITPASLKDVLDPSSAVLVGVPVSQIDNGPAICNRTVPVFDGKSRFNIRMQFKGIRKRSVRGFDGNTFVCSLRYEPVAGYRPHKENVQFMQDNKDMEAAVARIGNSNVYSLIEFSVRTRFGTVTGTSYKFVTQNR